MSLWRNMDWIELNWSTRLLWSCAVRAHSHLLKKGMKSIKRSFNDDDGTQEQVLAEETSNPPKTNVNGKEPELTTPRCIGVQLAENRKVWFDMAKMKEKNYSHSIILMHGFVTTFIRLLPESVCIKYKVPLEWISEGFGGNRSRLLLPTWCCPGTGWNRAH